jgi:hypothetical protein
MDQSPVGAFGGPAGTGDQRGVLGGELPLDFLENPLLVFRQRHARTQGRFVPECSDGRQAPHPRPGTIRTFVRSADGYMALTV